MPEEQNELDVTNEDFLHWYKTEFPEVLDSHPAYPEPDTTLMLDSGAFAVWNSGSTVDFDAYVQFCKDHPKISYYVNLDVMPGNSSDKAPTNQQREEACQQSWRNYHTMINAVPKEKVIPVFHFGERFEWLENYLDAECPYIGLSLGGRTAVSLYADWLTKVKQYVLDSSGKPIVKTHGFGLTSFPVMKFMPWHSVDSASWVRSASYGAIYVPKFIRGRYRYDIAPRMINFSPKSPDRDVANQHYTTLNSREKLILDTYLTSLDPEYTKLGQYEVVAVADDYKKQDGEIEWDSKTKRADDSLDFPEIIAKQNDEGVKAGEGRKLLRVLDKGLITHHQSRFYCNSMFLKRANETISVDNIYFAGAVGSVDDRIERQLNRRLISYHDITSSSVSRKLLEMYENDLL